MHSGCHQKREGFGVPDAVIADSFEIQAKCFNAAMRRLRDKGFDI